MRYRVPRMAGRSSSCYSDDAVRMVGFSIWFTFSAGSLCLGVLITEPRSLVSDLKPGVMGSCVVSFP